MKRNESIDMLRGTAMAVMILTHATANFLRNELAYFLWNTSQFAVCVFLFCSFYLFFKNPRQDLPYIKKRFRRLFMPYFIFLFFFIPLQYFHDQRAMNMFDVMRYATLTTAGNDLSWLVLLFFTLLPVGFLVSILEKKNKVVIHLFSGMVFISTLIFLFYKPPFNFKLIMWLPWSLVILFTWFFVKHEDKRYFLFKTTLFMSILFIITYSVNIFFINRLSFYDNKYPPNLYHLSYGLLWTCLLLIIAKQGLFNIPFIKPFLNYLSRNSYPIYFIHFFILYYFSLFQASLILSLHWWGFFGLLLVGSMAIQLFANKLIHRL